MIRLSKGGRGFQILLRGKRKPLNFDVLVNGNVEDDCVDLRSSRGSAYQYAAVRLSEIVMISWRGHYDGVD